jgi:hypothetical protein
MAVFPFTVRATDSEGSYADRQFNITVRNSRVERFMVVNSAHAWTSPDGAIWTQRLNQGGSSCAYGNGFWMVMSNPNTSSFNIRKSTDGINYNFVAFADMVFRNPDGTPITMTTSSIMLNTLTTRVRFWNGKFWFMTTGNSVTSGNSANSLMLYSSPDGVTWTVNVLVYSGSPTVGLGFQSALSTSNFMTNFSDADGAFWINNPVSSNANGTPMGWTTTDGVTFTPVKNGALASTVNQFCNCLTRINGLYLAQHTSFLGGGPANFAFSTDGLNWTQGSMPATQTNGSSYAAFYYMNGVIYSMCTSGSSGTPVLFYMSTDGITWTSGSYTGFLSSNGTSIPAYVAKNGVILVSASIMTSINTGSAINGVRFSVDGTTFTQASLPSDPTSIVDAAAM